jgi:hypothetical protein
MQQSQLAAREKQWRAMWALGAIATIAFGCAVYFALNARQENSRSASLSRELSEKQQELSAAQEQLTRNSIRDWTEPRTPVGSLIGQAITSAMANPPPGTRSSLGRELWRTPGLRESLRQSHLAMVRPIYDPMLTQLNLSPDQRIRFYDLQYAIAQPEAFLDMPLDAASTPEERAQIEASMREVQDSAFKDLHQLLGPKDYALYETYRNKESESLVVEQFRHQVDPRSVQLTDWQCDRLRDLLVEARTQYPPIDGDMTASREAVFVQAAQYLTPAQLASFQSYLHNQDEMAEAIRKLLPPGK